MITALATPTTHYSRCQVRRTNLPLASSQRQTRAPPILPREDPSDKGITGQTAIFVRSVLLYHRSTTTIQTNHSFGEKSYSQSEFFLYRRLDFLPAAPLLRLNRVCTPVKRTQTFLPSTFLPASYTYLFPILIFLPLISLPFLKFSNTTAAISTHLQKKF